MTEPFKLGCHCGFLTTSPQEFLDHQLVTQHIPIPAGEEDAALAEFVEAFSTIQHFAAAQAAGQTPGLPEGMEINPVSVDDILADEDLSDEEKQAILGRLEEIKGVEGRKKKGA